MRPVDALADFRFGPSEKDALAVSTLLFQRSSCSCLDFDVAQYITLHRRKTLIIYCLYKRLGSTDDALYLKTINAQTKDRTKQFHFELTEACIAPNSILGGL